MMLAAALGCLSAGGARAAGGDAVRGERQFQRCFACHSVDPGEAARLQGPSLAGVVGRRAASVTGFEYSDAMKAKGAAGLVWDASALDRYLADPEAFVPGTTMSVPPLGDAQARADLIAYLSARTPGPSPRPARARGNPVGTSDAYFAGSTPKGVDVAGPSPQTRIVACSSLAPSKCTPLA